MYIRRFCDCFESVYIILWVTPKTLHFYYIFVYYLQAICRAFDAFAAAIENIFDAPELVAGVGPNQLPGKAAISYENGLVSASISLFSASKRAL